MLEFCEFKLAVSFAPLEADALTGLGVLGFLEKRPILVTGRVMYVHVTYV